MDNKINLYYLNNNKIITARFLKYVWSFYNIIHERIKIDTQLIIMIENLNWYDKYMKDNISKNIFESLFRIVFEQKITIYKSNFLFHSSKISLHSLMVNIFFVLRDIYIFSADYLSCVLQSCKQHGKHNLPLLSVYWDETNLLKSLVRKQ